MSSLSIEADREMVSAALLLATLSVGSSRIEAAPDLACDIAPLLTCLVSLGAAVEHRAAPDGSWVCDIGGRGLSGLVEPDSPLMLSGAAALQLAAVLAVHPIETVLTGAPLPRDLLALLRAMGASITGRVGALADDPVAGPFWISGPLRPVPPPEPITARPALIVALSLAALNVPGEVTLATGASGVLAALLAAFGADISAEDSRLIVRGEAELKPASIRLISLPALDEKDAIP